MNWYLDVLQKYAVFNGRARRKEYWMFILFNSIFSFGIAFIEGVVRGPALQEGAAPIFGSIYGLLVLIPAIAVGVRRMHDTDHSGWFLLIPIYNLILACTEGTRGPNRFGSDPKTEDSAAG